MDRLLSLRRPSVRWSGIMTCLAKLGRDLARVALPREWREGSRPAPVTVLAVDCGRRRDE